MKPKYIQIAEIIEDKIKSNELKADSMLPIESALQEEFNVSRVTIRKSLQLLVDKRLINRSRGKGTYINDIKSQHDALHLLGFIEEVSRQGKIPSSQVIQFELIKPTSQLMQKLDLEPTDSIYEIHRIRSIDNEPEIYEITYMPVSLFPDLSISIMNGSKYEYIEKTKKLKISKSRKLIEPHVLNSKMAKYLNEQESAAILKVESIGYLSNDKPFEYTLNYFRLNQYRFELESNRI